MDQRDYHRAVELLMTLVEEYPKAPLPRFYLGIALSHANRLPEDPAHFSYARAMGLPGAEAELRSWALGHPMLVEHLRWFGVDSLEKTRELLNSTTSPDGAPAAVEGTTRHIIEMAAHALRSALAVDPTSKETIQNLATIAEFQKDYQVAHDRLSDLLTLARKKQGGASPAEVSTWRLQRSRVSTLRARELSASTVERDRRRALELADEAVADLDHAAGAIVDFQRLYYFSFRTEALLTRGEIRRLLRRRNLGLADAREAKLALETWLGLARSSGNPVPSAVAQGYLDRLRDLRARASAESPSASANPTSSEPSKAKE